MMCEGFFYSRKRPIKIIDEVLWKEMLDYRVKEDMVSNKVEWINMTYEVTLNRWVKAMMTIM